MSDSATTTSTAQQPENNGTERLFTQSEVNDIVRERLARERAKSAQTADDLTARENDLKAREDALAAKSRAFDAWQAKESCRKYLTDNHLNEKLLEKLDTSDPEAFKTAVQAVQKATDGGYTVHTGTVTTGAEVANPPLWLSDERGYNAGQIKRAFGLND